MLVNPEKRHNDGAAPCRSSQDSHTCPSRPSHMRLSIYCKIKKSTYSTYFAFYMVDNQCLSGRSMVENRTTMDLPSTYQVPEDFRTFKPSSQILAISDQ